MSKLDGYSEADQKRIKNLTVVFLMAMTESGELKEGDEEGLKAALPKAFAEAKAVVNAVNEYLCG